MSPLDLGGLRDFLQSLVGGDKRPLVVFSAVWPFARALKQPGPAVTDGLLDILSEIAGPDRLLAMPTFASGYRDGVCDLDREPSTTGALTERFRLSNGVRRSVSAFFSFAVRGPGSADVVGLRPRQAWGDGSVYDWCERNDVEFLMLGCHPTSCSYLHRAEFLLADLIRYRYPKVISGRVRHEGQTFDLSEELFVRARNPDVVNDFTVLTPALVAGGMRIENFAGVSISAMRACAMRDVTLAALKADPLLVVKNRQDYS